MKCSHRSFLNNSILAISLTSLLAAGVYATFRNSAADLAADAQPIVVGHTIASADLEAELISITPNGFEPAEITRPAGRFVLMFDNQSGLRPLELRVERPGVPHVAELRLSRKTASTRVLSLPAGEYQVTEAYHSAWSLKLTLTNR